VHELSIAMSLVDAACEQAERLGSRQPLRVLALHLRLGPLSGVVKEALAFSFELAAADTAIAGARLEIEEVPVTVRCPACREERRLASIQHFRCPVCDAPTPEVVHGKELELVALEVDETEGQEGGGQTAADRTGGQAADQAGGRAAADKAGGRAAAEEAEDHAAANR
jgi:hydrogenase nickel incorporation protein HypA/HybF